MSKDLERILENFRTESQNVNTKNHFESLRIKYLGRKRGILTKLADQVKKLPVSEREGFGTKFKVVRSEIVSSLTEKDKMMATPSEKPQDVTIPGKQIDSGGLHPVTTVIEEVKNIFHYLGFSWLDGPEVESDEYNFQKLNMPPDHPARDVQQTYYINEKTLLRTHTSNMQVRYLEKNPPPVRVLFPGRVYRRDMPDATHLPSFYQIEGLLVDSKSTMTDLLGVLDFFVKGFFGDKSKTRVYGHNFPYTEPSIEVEVRHPKKGWIEILGAGMVHPNVLKNAGLNPDRYRGWAFGMGPDRLVMLKYGINDLRTLYKNDIRFLRQF